MTAPSPGNKLGPYEIVSPLGAGGMSEIYRARDTKLGHQVAIQVVPKLSCRDPERVSCFQREAKVLATLNNPNLAAIYGVGDHRLKTELHTSSSWNSSRRIHSVSDYVGSMPVEEAISIGRSAPDYGRYA